MRRKQPYFETAPDAPAPFGVTIRRRIRFSDVDALGIVWHGRYPALFEEAQTELGHRCGLTYEAYRNAGIAAPVAQFHADYLLPLRLDEICSVTATLHWSEGARLNTEYRIRNGAGKTACTGYTIQLFTALDTGEALYCPPELWDVCRARWRAGEFHD